MIQRIILENFKRYRGKHEIVFKTGLNLIQGHNDAGKSSIFHAISFVLFNQTPTLRTTTYPLITVGEPYTRVTLEMVSNKTGLLYRITRYRPASRSTSSRFEVKEYKPGEGWHTILSSSSGAKERDLRVKLYELFSIDKNVFFNVIYAEQKEFVRLIRGGSEVRKILDSLLGISAVISAKNAVRETINELKNRISELETIMREAPDFEELINDTKERIKELSDKLISTEKEYRTLSQQLKKLHEKSEKLNLLRNKLKDLRRARERLIQIRAQKQRALNEYNQLISPWGDITRLEGEIRQLSSRINEITRSINQLSYNLKEIEDEIARANQRLGYLSHTLRLRKDVSRKAKCPTCGQPIDKRRIQKEIETLELESSKLSKVLDELSKRREHINKRILELRDKREELKEEISKLRTIHNSIMKYIRHLEELDRSSNEIHDKIKVLLTDLSNNLASLGITISCNMDDLDTVEAELGRIYESHMEEYYSISGAVKSLQSQIKNLLDNRRSLMKYLQQLERNMRIYEDARTKIQVYRKVLTELIKIEDCYAVLENELRRRILSVIASRTYYWYRQLISDPLYLSVELDPETYELKALPHGFKEPQPVRSFSGGGHETIFALAFRLALADILGFRDFLLLDEPTDATDTSNRDAIVEALHKATERFKQILLITHHGVGSEVSAHILHVYYDKTEGTSKVKIIRD